MRTRDYWLGISAAFVGGALIGATIGRAVVEKKLRDEYKESSESLGRVGALLREMSDDMETFLTEEAKKANEDQELAVVTGDIKITPATQDPDAKETWVEPARNDYHAVMSAKETPTELFVDGGVNDYGVSYIEEEEFLEEDGRFKGHIDLIFEETGAVFIMDGNQIDDWDQRIGDSIVVDFYKLVPPGVNPVLYVRNHRTDEDYEVVRVSP